MSSCCAPPAPVPVSSPVARCVRSWSAPASTTCCPRASARTTRSTSSTRRSRPCVVSSARRPWRLAVACRSTRSPRPPCPRPGGGGLEAERRCQGWCVMGRLRSPQTRGKVGTLQQHRDTLRTLGLKRINDVVVRRTAWRSVAWSVRWPTWSPLRRLTTMVDKKAGTEQNEMALKVHHLRPAPVRRPPRPVGRGEGSKGKTAGRGTKGTKAATRSLSLPGGHHAAAHAVPKLAASRTRSRRPTRSSTWTSCRRSSPRVGTSPSTDLIAGRCRPRRSPRQGARHRRITVAVNVTADAVSSSAKEKIEAAGGSVTPRGLT